jgi:hypothetical protein
MDAETYWCPSCCADHGPKENCADYAAMRPLTEQDVIQAENKGYDGGRKHGQEEKEVEIATLRTQLRNEVEERLRVVGILRAALSMDTTEISTLRVQLAAAQEKVASRDASLAALRVEDQPAFVRLQEENARLREQLETERMRLAGCGVAAMQNTAASTNDRILPESPYWSASYGDVCRAVDREIVLREQLAAAIAFSDENIERLTKLHGQALTDLEAAREEDETSRELHAAAMAGVDKTCERLHEENTTLRTGVSIALARIATAQEEIAKLRTCETCDGTGMMTVVARVLLPDEREEVEQELCGECHGTGLHHYAMTLDKCAALDAENARLVQLLAEGGPDRCSECGSYNTSFHSHDCVTRENARLVRERDEQKRCNHLHCRAACQDGEHFIKCQDCGLEWIQACDHHMHVDLAIALARIAALEAGVRDISESCENCTNATDLREMAWRILHGQDIARPAPCDLEQRIAALESALRVIEPNHPTLDTF